MRSGAEIAFRLRQELVNLRLLLAPPSLPAGHGVGWPLALPPREEAAALLRGTPYATEVLALAGRIAGGETPVFEQWLDTGAAPAWRRDYQSGKETGLDYFRRIPYLDFTAAGDHKWIWEINRHQQLVTLAQAWVLDGKSAHLEALWGQLGSWLTANPFQRGMNWTSALEVAFRAWSWCWIWHLAGDRMPPALRHSFLEALYRHGLHLEVNLSVYFSPNTHLLGEALVLYTLGRLFPAFPGAGVWTRQGGEVMRRQYAAQVAGDGSYFEQSTYYHVYALDMFLWFQVLEPGTAAEREVTAPMAAFLDSLLGETGSIPVLGDDDGGRCFHPYGTRSQFGRSTMAVQAVVNGDTGSRWRTAENLAPVAVWWLGEKAVPAAGVVRPSPPSRWFPDAGLAVMRSGGAEIVFDGGPFGPWGGGHSHADTLSLTLRQGGEVLIDPGTFTYISDPAWRSRFRSAAAHNTVVAGTDGNQAEEAGPFGWREKPRVRLLEWESDAAADRVSAECRYGDIVHRRAVLFDKQARCLWVADRLEGPAGVEPEFAQRWHMAADWEKTGVLFTTENPAEITIEESWRSEVFGEKERIPVIVVRWKAAFPTCRAVLFDLAPAGSGCRRLIARWEPETVDLRAEGGRSMQAILRMKKG